MPNSSQNSYENPHLDLGSSQILNSEIEALKLALAQRDQTVDRCAEEVERLGEILRQFKRDVYGQRSERWVPAELYLDYQTCFSCPLQGSAREISLRWIAKS